MTEVESISQSVELNLEEAVQLENFLNLLVDLKIIEPLEQVSIILPVEIEQNQDFPTGEIELLRSPVQLQVPEAPPYISLNDVEPSKIPPNPLKKGGI